MPNIHRGDAELVAGEHTYTMRLTLGALAEIESGLGLADLGEIESRLRRLSASDLAVVAAALLRGGGHDIAPAEVLALPADLGDIVRAITDAFGAAGGARAKGGAAPPAGAPFPGPARSRSASA